MDRAPLCVAAALCASLAAPAAFAQSVQPIGSVVPVPMANDEPRVVTAAHNANRVVRLLVPPGGGTLVTFSPGETLFDVGNLPEGWNKSSVENKLAFFFVGRPAATVVHVISQNNRGESRRYMFELIPSHATVRLDGGEGGDAGSRLVADAGGGMASDVSPPPARRDVPMVALDMTYPPARGAVGATKEAPRSTAPGGAASPTVPSEATPRAARRRGPRAADAGAVGRLDAEMVEAPKLCNGMGAGDSLLVPISFCQDGIYSYFVFAGQAAPVFTLDAQGHEHAVDQSPDPRRPGVIVARATSPWWTVRMGTRRVAAVFDAAYNPIRPRTGTNTASPGVQTYVDPAAQR